METKMNKILVLSDLNRSAETTLKSAVSLAKMINGEIELFYVKKPTEVVKTDNQFSALRSMKDVYCSTDSEIEELVASISNEYKINIGYRLTFGNVKNEIENYLEAHKPDLIVMGKRAAKPFQLAGDGITEFVMDNYEGTVLVASEENALVPNHPLTLGLLNGAKPPSNLSFSKDLLNHSIKPLKVFKIIEPSASEQNLPVSSNSEAIEFVFHEGENSVNNLSKYLLKNNINLLCIERSPNTNTNFVNIVGSDFKKALSKLQVSLLFAGKQKYAMS